MQLFPLLTSTLPWRTRGSSQNAVDNGILYSGLIARVQMQHICALLLFALICYNSSCHKFQQITKEMVNRVDKPLEMFIWRIKEGKKAPKAGEDIYQTNWDQWSKRHREVNQKVSPSEMREPPGKEWLRFQVRKETLHFAEKHQSSEKNLNVGIAFCESWGEKFIRTIRASSRGHTLSSRSSAKCLLMATLKGKEMELDPLNNIGQHFSTRFPGWHSARAAGFLLSVLSLPSSEIHHGESSFSLSFPSHFIFFILYLPKVTPPYSLRQKRSSESLKAENKLSNSTRSLDRQCCKLSWKRPSYCSITWFPLL